MPKTIAGLFPNTVAAQNAKHELVNEGYSAEDIRVIARDGGAATTSSNEPDSVGFASKIGSFFRSLTGAQEDVEHFTKGIENGGALLSVTVGDGQEQKAVNLLEQYGARNVENQGAQAAPAAAAGAVSSSASGHEMAGNVSIPVVKEELVVGKRQVQGGGVRVYSHSVESPVEESVRLREERVHVERQSVNRPATEADFTGFQEGTMELTESAEEAVVSKSARVVEEILVGKESSEHTQAIIDTVRHTEVEVDQLDTDTDTASDKYSALGSSK